MKRQFLIVAFVCLLAAFSFAQRPGVPTVCIGQPVTSNIQLIVPNHGLLLWDACYNYNFQVLDLLAGGAIQMPSSFWQSVPVAAVSYRGLVKAPNCTFPAFPQSLNSDGSWNCATPSGGGGGSYSFTAPLSLSGSTVSIPQATSSVSGYLANTDWAIFNAKQAALGFTPLNPANNLSELTNEGTARTNLGLGSAATQNTSAFDASGAAAAVQTNLNSEISRAEAAEATKAPLASPALTGTPTAPTPSTADNSTKLATTAYVQAQGFLTSNAVNAVFGRTGSITAQTGDYTVSQVTGAAPLASPALTGTPTAPTPATNDNSTKLATTAYVQAQGFGSGAVSSVFGRTGAVVAATNDYSFSQISGNLALGQLPTAVIWPSSGTIATTSQLPAASNTTPNMDGTGSAGSSAAYARGDHTHPTDSSRAPLASPTFTGTPAAPTPSLADNSTKLATTAFVAGQGFLTSNAVGSVFGRTGTVTAQSGDYSVGQVTGAAPLASPTFTGTPVGPTPSLADNSTKLATTAFVAGQGFLTANAVSTVFGRTGAVTANSGDYSVGQVTGAAPLASPTFTGTPAGPTPSTADNSTKLATTAYVQAQGFLTSGSAVSSAFGRTGAVTGQSADYAAFYPVLSGNNAFSGNQAITGNLSASGSFTQTGTGPTQWSGKEWAGTSVTVPGSYDFSFGVGSDNVFKCQLLSGSNCMPPIPVTSVFGRTGAISGQASDYSGIYAQLTANNSLTGANIFGSTGNITTLFVGSGASNGFSYCIQGTGIGGGYVTLGATSGTCGGAGAVTSVFGRTGAVVAAANDYSLSQISATFSPPLSLSTNTLSLNLFPVNPQTATYSATSADFGSCKTITIASGTFTITLPASGSQPPSGQCIHVINYGSGTVTIARNGQSINGGTSSLTLNPGSASAPSTSWVVSDGTNYEATVGGASSGGMVYPGAGVANSTGSGWGTSYVVGSAANDLVQLDGSARLPAVDGSLLVNMTAAQVGLGSVSNAAQAFASIYPNSAPASGQIGVGNLGGTAYQAKTMTGDATINSTGAVSVTKTGGVVFAPSATTDTTNAANISSGRIADARASIDTVLSTAANTYQAGKKQVFSSSGSVAGGKDQPVSIDPSSSVQGDFWYNSTQDRKAYQDSVGVKYLANTNDVPVGGLFTIAVSSTSVTVNNSAVTATSPIVITEDSSLGSALAVTCNTNQFVWMVTARVPGTSFTATLTGAPSINPACFSYMIQ